MIFQRKAVLLAKNEATYGEDPTPTATDNGILCESASFKPIMARVQRPAVHESVGGRPSAMGGRHYEVEATTEIMAAGAAAADPDAPRWAPLFSGVCATETLDGVGHTRSYSPVDPGAATNISWTGWLYEDGLVKKACGIRGNLKLSAKAGERVMGAFSGRGLMVDLATPGTPLKPVDEAFPAVGDVTYETEYPHLGLSLALTCGGLIFVCRDFEFDTANELTDRADLNGSTGLAGFHITGRAPTLKVTVEALTETGCGAWTTDAASDPTGFWAALVNISGVAEVDAATMAISLTCIRAASVGNRLRFDAPKAQLESIEEGDDGGVRTYALTFALRESSGNDEWRWRLY